MHLHGQRLFNIMVKKVDGIFYELKLLKNQCNLKLKIGVNHRGGKLCFEWRGYDNSFNTYIDNLNML